MRGIIVQPGATGRPGRETVRPAPGSGRSAGRRPGRRLALRGGLAAAVPAVLAVALAGPAAATPVRHAPGRPALTRGHASSAALPAAVKPAVPASPTGPIVSGYRSAKCAVPGTGASATPVVIAGCDESTAQDWTIEADGTIQADGKCLDIYRQGKASKTPVDLYACTGGANQQWTPHNGTLVNPVSGKCLDDPRFNVTDGTQLEIYACNGGANQQWKIPSATPAQTWNMTTDFASHPGLNPAPDQYGNPGVWSWEYGTAGQQSTYQLDTFDNVDPECDVENVYQWDDSRRNPFVSYNAGPTITDYCGTADTRSSHTVVVSPGAVSAGGTQALDSVIGWKSPVTGEVTVSATLQGINPYEPGVSWELYQGAESLAGPVTETSDQLSAIAPVSVAVTSGQSLYLEIGSDGTGGDYDDCALTLTITS